MKLLVFLSLLFIADLSYAVNQNIITVAIGPTVPLQADGVYHQYTFTNGPKPMYLKKITGLLYEASYGGHVTIGIVRESDNSILIPTSTWNFSANTDGRGPLGDTLIWDFGTDYMLINPGEDIYMTVYNGGVLPLTVGFYLWYSCSP